MANASWSRRITKAPKFRCLASIVLSADPRLFLSVSRNRGTHVERLMQARVIVLSEPSTSDDLGLVRCCETLRVEHLLAVRSIEPMVVPVLPWRSRIGSDRLDANASKLVLHFLRKELRVDVRADIFRRSVPR